MLQWLQSVRKFFQIKICLSVVIWIFVFTTGCSYDHPLSEVTCSDDAQCQGETRCQEGYCVTVASPVAGDTGGSVDINDSDSGPTDADIDNADIDTADVAVDTAMICESPKMECQGQCVDIMNHDDHCGQCDNPCTTHPAEATATCHDGECIVQCPNSRKFCENDDVQECIDPMSDSEHCGACANSCDDGFHCTDGECHPLPCWDAGAPFGGGDGTADDPHTICTAQHLEMVATDGFTDDHFLLYDDIDLQGTLVAPLGEDDFNGHFDGNDHTIRNFAIQHDGDDVGLFGVIGDDGVVVDLHLTDGDINGEERVGGLAGLHRGIIDGCSFDGTVRGQAHVGGLVGEMADGQITGSNASAYVSSSGLRVGGLVGEVTAGTIESSHATGDVQGDVGSVGGLIGRIDSDDGLATDCFATGDVDGDRHVGGLVGTHRGEITDCFAEGDITGTSDRVGGLVGANRGAISKSSARGTVSAGGPDVGGFVGQNHGDIWSSSARGDVFGDGEQRFGGFVGDHNAGTQIRTSFATGNVETSSSIRVGGFAGLVSQGAHIVDSYSTGDVSSSGGEEIGGFVGLIGSFNGGGSIETSYTSGHVDAPNQNRVRGFGFNTGYTRVEYCYWNSEGASVGDNHSIALNDEAFSNQSSFIGFDFEHIWEMSDERPKLQGLNEEE